MGPYAAVPYFIFAYLIIRVWILYGRKIPLIFLGLLLVGRYTVPEVLGPFGPTLLIILLAIALALIDRFKSVNWNSM